MTVLFLQWLFLDAPAAYLRYSRNVTQALANYFSLSLLSQTLFSPWRHDAVPLAQLPIRFWFQAFISNATSRTIGFIVRSVTILFGISTILIWNFWVGFFIIAWFCLPLLLIISILYGIRLLGVSG